MEKQWMIWVWWEKRDFMGADIDFMYFATLPEITPKIPYVNQSITAENGDYSMACTMMSSYVALLSIFWGNEELIEKRQILDEWIARGYKIGQWRFTQSGVKSATKVWNKNHPKKQVMYIKCEIWDGTYNTLFNKWYPCVTSMKLNSAYWKDKRDDSIVQGTTYSAGNRWHAICRMKGDIKDCQGKHCNTYPGYKANEFHVKDIDKLAVNWLYSDNVYFIVPTKGNIIEETAKKKLVIIIRLLTNKLKELSYNQTTKIVIDDFNNYFINNWL